MTIVTHSVWAFPRVSELEGAEAALSLAALEESVQRHSRAGPQALTARAVLWSLYQGSGSADPAAARSASEGQAAAARTAWASELYRLDHSERAPSELQRLWEGEEAAVRGDPANPSVRDTALA